MSTGRRAPKLGEIEQFSTETQTDTDFDMIRLRHLKPSTNSSNSPTSDVGDDPMFGSLRYSAKKFDLHFS
jgi:hypothetical protein